MKVLNGIVGILTGNNTTTVLDVNEEKFGRCPGFAPEVVVWN